PRIHATSKHHSMTICVFSFVMTVRTPNPTRRLLIRLGVFLLLGATVNVAVAWGCYGMIDPMVATPTQVSVYRWPPPPTWLATDTWRRFGREYVVVNRWTYHGRWLFDETVKRPTAEPVVLKDQAGFPLVALERQFASRSALLASHEWPLQPVWLGF